MTEDLIKRIKTLPPLPKSLIDIQAICNRPDGTIGELSKVAEKDPMIVANLLKSANSPLFGLGKEITAVSQAVSLFGMSMTRSIAVNASVKKLLKVDMMPYGITPEDFAEVSSTQAALGAKWFGKILPEKKDKLFLASLIQETGKILIADIVLQNDEGEQFKSEIECSFDISSIEQNFVQETTPLVTAAIFEHWKMDNDIIEMIRHSNAPVQAPEAIKSFASALMVLRTVVPVNGALSEANITRGLALANKLGFDHEVLEDCIDEILG